MEHPYRFTPGNREVVCLVLPPYSSLLLGSHLADHQAVNRRTCGVKGASALAPADDHLPWVVAVAAVDAGAAVAGAERVRAWAHPPPSPSSSFGHFTSSFAVHANPSGDILNPPCYIVHGHFLSRPIVHTQYPS